MIQLPAEPNSRSTMIRRTASHASSASRATTTPFPAASPSAFTTMGYSASGERR